MGTGIQERDVNDTSEADRLSNGGIQYFWRNRTAEHKDRAVILLVV